MQHCSLSGCKCQHFPCLDGDIRRATFCGVYIDFITCCICKSVHTRDGVYIVLHFHCILQSLSLSFSLLLSLTIHIVLENDSQCRENKTVKRTEKDQVGHRHQNIHSYLPYNV